MRAVVLLNLLEGDREILDELVARGLVPRALLDALDTESEALADEAAVRPDGELGPEEAELCRVARTLVRELDVNWPGVEIILRLRAELLATHHQVAALLALLAQRA